MTKEIGRGTFKLADKTVEFKIQKNKKVKYYQLTYAHDHGFIIHVANFLPQSEIDTILNRHRRWILNRLKQSNVIKKKVSSLIIRDGLKLQVLDDFYRLSLKVDPDEKMYWRQKEKVLEIHLTEENQHWISQIIIHWYKMMAKDFLYRRVPFWAQKIDINYNQIRVKNQGSLWGSCSRKRNLNFNWRILLLTPEAADYLIVHELAHLIELNHSRNFWKVVEHYLPHYKVLKQQIKEKNHLLKFP